MTSISKKPPPSNNSSAADEAQLPNVPGKDIAIAAAFPGETRRSGDAQVDHYETVICSDWRKSQDGLAGVCVRCAEALASLNHVQREQLHERLSFGKATFSKLATIGRKTILFDDKIQKHLPANWSIIYQLRDLTSEEIEAAISEKALNPRTTRNDLNKWISENSSHRKNGRRRRRKPINDADKALLRQLIEAFTGSPGLMAIWDECPRAVRSRFGRELAKLT